MKKSFKYRHSPSGAVLKIKAEKNGFASLRTIIVLLLIMLQFAVLFSLYFHLAGAFPWYMGLSLALSVISCIRTLSSERSPSSKAVWIFIILIFFYVGYLLYYISDERFFFRRPKKRYKKVFARAEQFRNKDSVTSFSDPRVEEDCKFLKKAGGFTAFTGSGAKYFPSGGLLFDDVIAELAKAERFVFIEFFIIFDGILFERVFEILKQKAESGVEVFVIYDDMGSHRNLSYKTKSRMRRCGIKLMSFNRLIPVIDIGLNYRDHRKIVVIDGKVAYTGGVNLADEYTNDVRSYGYWKDEGVRVTGEAVDGFSFIFLRQWEYLTRGEIDYTKYLGKAERTQSGGIYVPFSDGLDIESAVAKELYLNVISKSHERLYIMTPYLVPDDSINTMLINKAACGVDVRIVLPAVPDKAFVYKVTLNNARKLASHGVKIMLMRDSFVHSKLLLSDYCAVIGTINIDMRSFYQQFENALYTADEKVLAEVEKDFKRTFAECADFEGGEETLLGRAIGGILKILSPLM